MQPTFIAHTVKNGKTEKLFLDLLQLHRGDSETIFKTIFECLEKNKTELAHSQFAGMVRCSTMSSEHNGSKQNLAQATSHFTYIHCRNHHLALCFAHLIPQFPDFENFDSLLLYLYLLLKNSSIKQSIFVEVLTAYNLPTLKLIKTAITHWLSHASS